MSVQSPSKWLVLGAGAWGTALAVHLSQAHKPVVLWGHNPQHMEKLRQEQENRDNLPGISLASLTLVDDFDEHLSDDTFILLAVPSCAFSQTLKRLQAGRASKLNLVWATKGLDPESGMLLSDSITRDAHLETKMAVISGPSFAMEVAKGLPTAVTLGCSDTAYAQTIHPFFHHGAFRLYTSDDMSGVQLGGVMKNVLSIAVGISDGMGFGANARCALITRGLTELSRLGLAMGAKRETLTGLSGLGDLILTATDNQSRNRRFGLAIGQGMSIDEAMKEVRHVVEGYANTQQILKLSKRVNVSLPICEEVYEILFKGKATQDALETLLLRDAKSED